MSVFDNAINTALGQQPAANSAPNPAPNPAPNAPPTSVAAPVKPAAKSDVFDDAVQTALGTPTTNNDGTPSGGGMDLKTGAGGIQAAPQGVQPSPIVQSLQPTTAQPTGVLSRIGQGVLQSLPAQAIRSVIPTNATEETIFALGGPPALQLYRQGKAVVDTATNVTKAAGDKYHQAKQDFQRTIQDFNRGDWRNLASDVVSTGSDVVPPTMVGSGKDTRDLSEGMRPGGNLATPLTRQAVDAATMLATGKIGEAAEATETATTNPIDNAANKATGKVAGKANLSEGQAARPRPEPADTVQPDLQNNLRQTWQKVADEQHVTRPTATSIRDAGEQVGDAILARSKDLYHQIDAATAGKFQPNADALKNVNLKLRSITGTDEATESSLLAQKAKLESQQEDLFNQAQKNGVEKDVVDRAKHDFKTAQSIYDINHEIQMTTKGVRPGMPGAEAQPETVNSKSLMDRLNKQYNSGRLQSAVGDENSAALIGHSANAQTAEAALKESQRMNAALGDFPPTERRAVLDLVKPNTAAGKIYGVNTDWSKTLKDFDALGTDAQKARFQNPEAVRDVLRRQAAWQGVKRLAGMGGELGLASGAGLGVYESLKDEIKSLLGIGGE